ncbi:beta-phosphoglucomutase [Paenibacillus marinisediminis]
MSSIQAVIFDLDGVLVSTDEYHYLAWKRIAEQEGIPFDRTINDRLRGVSRMESLEIILEQAKKLYTAQEKQELAERKNEYYREYLNQLTEQDLLPGVLQTLQELKKRDIKIAVGSSSKNTPIILRQVGLHDMFDAVVDGNQIANSKPHPEVFLRAAEQAGADAASCVVVEDAEAGVDAALRAGVTVAAIGAARHYGKAHIVLESLDDLLAHI